jgi:hypothetical protein
MSDRIRSIGFLLLSLSAAGWIHLAITHPALADPTVSCNTHVNVGEFQTDAHHRGDRVLNPGELIGKKQAVNCVRVVDLDVYLSNANQIEDGWFIVNNANFSSPCPYPGDGQTPYLLIVVTIGTTQTCLANPPALTPSGSSNNYDSFELRNANGDYYWTANWDGTDITSLYTGFSFGYSATNTEVYNTGDSMYAEWNGLQYRDSSAFHDWDLDGCLVDNSTSWDTDLSSGLAHLYVKNTGSGFTC